MNNYLFILWVFLMMPTTSAVAEVKTLGDFDTYVGRAASVLKAKADLEAQHSDLLAKEAQKGFELFGSISSGYQKSPFAREPFGRFFDPAARLGLRYPLLGSAERQQRAIYDAETEVKIEGVRFNWSQRLAALFLEENYAAYWSAQKMLALNDAYVRQRDEGIEGILHKRHEAGLLLMSDYFEFLSAFEQAERARLEFSSNQDQALTRLSHLTDTVITPFEAIKPPLGLVATDLASDVNQPDLEILQAQIDNMQKIRETENWQGIDSDISATVFGGPAIPHPSPDSAQFGYGGAIGFNFRMPLEIVSFRRNEKSRVNSMLTSFQADYTRRDQELDLEFHSTLDRYRQLTQQIKFQRARLDAARESVRERYLRLQVLDEDVIEKYIQAINTYYRTAIEYLEAETEEWKLHIRLRQFVSATNDTGAFVHSGIGLEELIAPLQQARQFLAKRSMTKIEPIVMPVSSEQSISDQIHIDTTSDGFAVYVWDYDKLMTHPNFWEQSQAMRINRILLSLDAQQIISVASDPQALNKFIDSAHRHGIKIELLLGDPNWILPKERMGLLQIIKKLEPINFDGLHLDIEPDQLESDLVGKSRLEELIETVHMAKIVSPWSVGISIHPRYLTSDSSFDLCIPCQLKRIGIDEVAVMYYSLNINNIVAAFKSAMKNHPDLVFSLAQSLERELGPENSYVHKPRQFFEKAMMQLQDQLKVPNFGGLIIQSWQDWEAYNYENPL